MNSCARLQRSLSQAGFNLCRPTAHFYSTSGAANDTKPAASRGKSPRQTLNKTPTKAPKTLRGTRLERVPDEVGFDQWSWSEVNLLDKTIATAAGDLPISPLIDPTWVEARQRKKTKARPDKNNHKRFQRQLRQNAFAAAEGEAGEEATAAEKQAGYRYPISMLARHDLIENFGTPNRKHYGGHKRLAAGPSAHPLAKSARWRPDMYAVILDQRRRQIMEDLLYLSTLCEEQGRKYIIKVTGAKYAATYVHRAAFLWLGEQQPPVSKERNQESLGEADEAKEDGAKSDEVKAEDAKAEIDPEQYATVDIDGDSTTTRPVYNLPKLLGPANVARLRSESSVFKEGSLFLLRSQRSGPLNKKLWSLQGYLADYSKL